MNASIGNDIVFCALNSVSVLVCLLAVIMLFYLKLHTKIVYRLSLYQVLSALAFSTVETLQIVFINHSEFSQVYSDLCTAVGVLVVYTGWVKLLFTGCVTVHLFIFAVLGKNVKKLEALYVVVSLLFPVTVSMIPLATDTYDMTPTIGCYISAGGNDSSTQMVSANVELLVIWDAPVMLILLAASITMVTTVVSLCGRALRSNADHFARRNQYRNAMKQLLPLAAFPVMFFLFFIPVLVSNVLSIMRVQISATTGFVGAFFITTWSTAAGVTLIVHIFVSRACCLEGAEESSAAIVCGGGDQRCTCFRPLFAALRMRRLRRRRLWWSNYSTL